MGTTLPARRSSSTMALVGGMGVVVGVSKTIAKWIASSSTRSVRRWELVWVGLILLMGIQLLVYFE
jgi:hypothetical protein